MFSNKCVCRTAPATPGLLTILGGRVSLFNLEYVLYKVYSSYRNILKCTVQGLVLITTFFCMSSRVKARVPTVLPLATDHLHTIQSPRAAERRELSSWSLSEHVRGRNMVCQLGDGVVSAKMRVDVQRVRHNAIKLRRRCLLIYPGIPVVCKVFYLFANTILN